MDIQVVPIPEVGGAAVIIRDLSEMRRLERSRQELVANISHELRTPLTNIKALVETLLDGAIDDPSVSRGFLEKVEVEVDGLSQLVRELLELSLIESGQAPLEMQDTQVADIVYDVASRLHAQARRASIDLQVQIQDDIPAIKADGRRIQQVLVNLVHNAVKFTPAGGSITVGAEVRDRTVHVWVADTGIGIPDEDLPRIFERLYKVDRSRSSGGTGLGLAIAKHIVKAHGGEIWAESQQGKGSVFHFTIPITQEVSDAKGELRQGPERVAR
jgi:two-component system phosphate regulon sensor histidine kinase PhoR